MASFEAQLSKTNVRLLRAAAPIVSVFFLSWSILDLYAAPKTWLELFIFRVGVVVVNSAVVWWASKSRAPHRGEIGFWLWLLIWAGAVAVMLPFSEGSFEAYTVGLWIALFGAGVLPYWSVRWAGTNLAACAAVAGVGAYFADPSPSELVTFLFVVISACAVSLVTAAFKNLAVEKQYQSRHRLAEALEQAQAVDKLKSEFFANVSHELRTPLTLILAPLDELLGRAVSSSERNALKVVRRSAVRLLRMIDDLLDLARLEAGGMRLRVEELDVGALAHHLVENARPTAAQNRVEIFAETRGPLDDLYGDPHRIEIVLTNLIGNAVKFTPEGGRVYVRVSSDENGAIVEVQDNGPGVPASDREKIFERFVQLEASERRMQGGTGIGLALARELAELHGGSLTVQSEVGKGSTFRLFLPLGRDHFSEDLMERRQEQISDHPKRRAEDRLSTIPPSSAAAGSIIPHVPVESERILLDRGRLARVLVAEDEQDLREFMVGFLSEEFEVLEAKTGAEAFEKMKTNRPDLLLTDIMMPGTSGLDLCRQIKDDPTLQHIPVVLLTARGETETALEGFSSGADDFVAKPFHPQVLAARLRAHLKNRSLSLQLADQARLASAGTLAAGLAHEIKNPINAIVNAAKVLQQGTAKPGMNEKLLGVIIDGVERINSVVSVIETHARPADGTELAACNVQEGIESTLELVGHRLDGVQVHKDFAVADAVRAPARAFNQVLLNLIDNALLSGAKNLWVELKQAEGRVLVAVADDGPGVPPDLVQRIFDPFFTTRQEGEGTGLGLHLSRRIAQDCGGELRYEPRKGGGARFVMDMPAMERAA